jgi:hypothetical protein
MKSLISGHRSYRQEQQSQLCTEGAQRELQFVQPGCTSGLHRERYPNAGAPKAAGRDPATACSPRGEGPKEQTGSYFQ